MKTTRHCLSAWIAAGLLASAAVGHAQIIQPLTEATSKDAMAYGHQPEGPIESTIRASTPAYGAHFVSLIQFDLSSITAANSDAIVSSYLRLYASAVGIGGTVTLSPITSAWRENETESGTAPIASYNALYGYTFEGEPIAATITWGPSIASVNILTGATGFYDWDVTNTVKNWYNGSQANYGFLIEASGPAAVNVTFADVDSSPGVAGSAPQLVVVPEPSASIALLGGVGLLCLFRRRSPRVTA